MPDLKKLITLEALQAALPSWLKSSSKPSYTADEISDTNTTNKFVTSTEKNTWNAKGTYSKPSGGIPKTDLSSLVQSSLDKADSAVQTETDPTVPTWAKQTNKPSYTQDEVTDGTTYKRVTQTEKNAWSGKQNALTTTQMSAVNSGINSTKVSQISTNQTNILYSLNTGVKNVLPIKFPDRTVYGVTLINNNDGSIRVNGTNSQSSGTILLANIQSDIYTDGYSDLSNFLGKNKDYVLVGNTTTANLRIQVLGWNSSSDNSIIASSSTDAVSFNTSTWNYIAIRLWAAASAAFSNVTITPMICTADAWAQSHDHQPPALPNSDLTRLEAEDRVALVEEIDAGDKNKLDWASATYLGNSNCTYSKTDTSLIASAGSSAAESRVFYSVGTFAAGNYVFKFKISSATISQQAIIYISTSTQASTSIASIQITANGEYELPFSWSGGTVYLKFYPNITNTSSSNTFTVSNMMICTKAAFNVSNKFVPYRASWDLVGKDAMLSIQAKAANDTMFTFDISEYKGTASNRYRYGLLVGGYNASNPCLYHVFLNANNEATLTAVLPSGRTLTASTSGTALTITASDTMYGGLRLLWLD